MVMALLNPHPALKVAAPESPMVDGWMGDDWFHYGAFRQPNLDYFTEQTTKRGAGRDISARALTTTTRTFRRPDRRATLRELPGLDQLPFWHVMVGASGVRRLLAGAGAGQDDCEDAADGADDVGAGPVGPGRYVGRRFTAIARWSRRTRRTTMNYLVMGPWFHSQINRQGRGIGPFDVVDRYVSVLASRCAAAVLQSVSEAGISEGGYGAGVDV